MSELLGRGTRAVVLVLRFGNYAAALLLVAGLLWVMTARDVPIQVGPAMPLTVLAEQLAAANPYAVMQLGLVLLLSTPLARLVIAGVSCWRQHERHYALVALAALSIILASILLARW